MRFSSIAACLICLSGSAWAADKPSPPEPVEKPNWAELRENAERRMKAEFFDPESARFIWTSGFAWGYVKPALVKRSWGWVACVSVNAKNRMGGYVGAEPRWFIYAPGVGYGWDSVRTTTSQCDTPNKVPVQPALSDIGMDVATSHADQLAKLAGLLEKGLITRDEFDREKSALLGR